MKLRTILSEILKEEEYDYRMQHGAPSKDDAPLYDLTKNGIYPDDVYSSEGLQYYGTGDTNIDRECYSIISSYKNKPNAIVTIYRAMPDFTYETKNKANDIHAIYNYVYTYGFPPAADRIGTKVKLKTNSDYYQPLIDKYYELNYDKGKYGEYMNGLLADLKTDTTNKSKINPGDWVSISKQYCKEHMEGEKNWIIVSKKVKASQVFTSGDSWAEWGYQP